MKRRSSTKLPHEPSFFVDRNLGKAIVELLREAGFDAKAHDDFFAQNTPDTEWIPVVAKRKWVVLTGDKRIGFNDLEIDAHMTAGGRAYLPKGRMKPLEFGSLIIASRAKILRHLKHQHKYGSGPYMAKIARDDKNLNGAGSVEKWVDTAAWREKIKKRTR